MSPPLVSVGIPAYDRPAELERAVRSALAQDLRNLEVLVSDDASPDPAVAATGERLAAEDPRVRFVRQPANLGHAANYRWVAEHARGEYFMWLSDDDRIDPRYVGRCLEVLRSDPATRLVCGLARYHRGAENVVDERRTDLVARRPGARVARYFSRVNMNGPLFGLSLRSDRLAVPFAEVAGGDWLVVAGHAALGAVRTLPDVHVHRSMGGLGSDPERLARSFGFEGWLARHHHVWVAAHLWREIAAGRGAFARLGRTPRLCTATLSAIAILVRFPVVDALRGLGLQPLERQAIAFVRRRDAENAR